jgi:hypothetical protein
MSETPDTPSTEAPYVYDEANEARCTLPDCHCRYSGRPPRHPVGSDTPSTEALTPCVFVPANEPWTCNVHLGVRTSLDEPQCDVARPAEPFNDAYLDNIRQGIADGRSLAGRYIIRRLLATIDAAREAGTAWPTPTVRAVVERDSGADPVRAYILDLTAQHVLTEEQADELRWLLDDDVDRVLTLDAAARAAARQGQEAADTSGHPDDDFVARAERYRAEHEASHEDEMCGGPCIVLGLVEEAADTSGHTFEPMRNADDPTCSRCLRVHPEAADTSGLRERIEALPRYTSPDGEETYVEWAALRDVLTGEAR